MTTNATILDVANLSVGYGAGDDLVTAVADVSFRLDRGHVLGIAGESGSGKSTLVYGLTRLLRAPGVLTGGSAIITRPDGTSLDLLQATEAQLRDVRWTQISVVMQSALNALNPLRKIGKEFHEVLKVHMPSMTKADRNARSIELLALVGLTPDRLARYPHELSGGQRQRVMIAMALALEPDLVIMDEPTTALDVVTQREIVAELHSLRERLGFAMLFITHDLSLLVELADDIMVMYAGRIVERAPALDLYNAPRHPYTLGLMDSFPPLHGERVEMTGIPGTPPSLKALPSGCPFEPRCASAHSRCSEEIPPLLSIDGGRRSVACFLHDPTNTEPVPVRLQSASEGGRP
jgi:peptide/nickel transport system ATP-binding protein